ncbi:MAG: hypothetical protein ACRDJW_07555 [Thermomicrobiales bacterium]
MTDDRDHRPPGDPTASDPPALGIEEEGPTYRAGAAFDPTPYMRRLRGKGGGQDYLDVRIRLLWLRREHPDAEIVTEHVQIDDKSAIFKATVTLPSGGKASGYGSETASDFPDFIEKAETKAIGRALNALGYGAQFAEEDREDEPPASPPPRSERKPRPAPPTEPEPPAATAPAPTPMPARRESSSPPAPTPRSDTPIDISAGRERQTPPAPQPASEPASRAATAAATADEEEPPLEDYSWTAFWGWARQIGFQNRGAIEALIGRPITDLTPAQVRNLIREKRGEE